MDKRKMRELMKVYGLSKDETDVMVEIDGILEKHPDADDLDDFTYRRLKKLIGKIKGSEHPICRNAVEMFEIFFMATELGDKFFEMEEEVE